ncbi:MAG: molybdopterin-dependent oxidoreductase [bacterium]|nr:molybdopterin-dependent oxidoreductase [bacterium]
MKNKVIGKNYWKVDGVALVTGEAQYVDDIELRDMRYIKILTSPYAHARIKNIDTRAAEKLPGVQAVLTYKNVPRILHTTAGQGYPEPSPYDAVMFDTKVRFVGDRVAAVAANSLTIAKEAVNLIKVNYEVLPAILDPREAMKPGAPIIHDEPDLSGVYDPKRNIAAHNAVEIGNVKQGYQEADAVCETEIELPYYQHTPLEPHICITYLDENNRLVIRTSTQVPFHCRRIIAQVLEILISRIRVIKPRIGGGFGGKQEILLEDICALVTLRTGKPAKLEYTRAEEFISARTRHPMLIAMKAGIKKDGSLTALEMNILSNTGAYGTHSLTVMSNTGSKNLPLYHSPNIKFYGNAVYTNLPVAGACRGYGATQGAFAREVLIDELCAAIDIDPLEFRKKNHIKLGETSPVFVALGEGREGFEQYIKSCGLDECINRGAEAIGWYTKQRRYRAKSKIQNPKSKKSSSFLLPPSSLVFGVGMCCLMQGSGIPGVDMGGARIKMNEDGSFNLLIGATDLGTGSDTILAQIAAETLAVDVAQILVYSSDTDFTPFDKGAYASSTTYISGMAVKKTAELVKQKILQVAAEILNEPIDNFSCTDATVVSKSGKKVTYQKIMNRSLYSANQFQIEAEASHMSYESPPPFAAHFAEVAVDTETGLVQVLNYVAAVDAGVVINPNLAEGQTEGAVLNGIGYALSEQMIFDKTGKMVNPSLHDYRIFSTKDVPPIKTILIPTYEPSGPFGAKSVAEISINGPLPAIANAIYDACGIKLRKPPFTPEKVLLALKARIG